MLHAHPRIHAFRSVGAIERRKRIVTDKFIATIRLEHRIILVGPHAAFQAVHIVFQLKSGNI